MINVAIVGATGLVGETIIKVLEEEGLIKKIRLSLFASDNSHGKLLTIGKIDYRLTSLNEDALRQKFDYVFFSAGDEVSKEWAKKFVKSGSIVIDNSNAFRREKTVPLVVPEINCENIENTPKIISNPNCSTIQLAVVVHRLLEISDINKIIVSSYQSVSGAGRPALSDLVLGTNKFFDVKIQNNIIAQIGGVEENGFCTEENKIMFELNKILGTKINILATTVRVPIPYCHGESVYIKFKNKVDINLIKSALRCSHITLLEDEIAFPSIVAGTNQTYICRLRLVKEKELMLFIVADNLRRGAAYNAVETFKRLIKFEIKNK